MNNRGNLLLLLGMAFMLFIGSGNQFVEAQGCSISTFTMNPVDPYTHGVAVQLYGASDCGTVRFEIDGSPKAETGSSTQTETWKTGEFNPGNHDVCFVARGDGGWSNAARSCRRVYVEGSQAPPPGSNSGDDVACWINNFIVTPSSARVGSTFNLSGQGQCDGNVRAIRFTIDGSAFGEYGGNTHNSSWGSSGKSTGNHRLCFQVTAGNWNSDKAESCVNITLTSSGSATNDVAVGDTATNGQSGQTTQSGPNQDQPASAPAPITTENNGNRNVTTDNSGTQPQTSTSSSSAINYYLGGSSRLSGHYVKAGFDDIRIRSGPGTSNSQLGLLIENHYYPVLQTRNGWVQIQGSKGSGWVSLTVIEEFGGSSSSSSSSSTSSTTTSSSSSSSLCPSFSAPVSNGDTAYVTPGVANIIRSQAGTEYAAIDRIPAGNEFDIIGGPQCNDSYRWWRVRYDGTTGWTADGVVGDIWIARVENSSNSHNQNISSVRINYFGETYSFRVDEQHCSIVNGSEIVAQEASRFNLWMSDLNRAQQIIQGGIYLSEVVGEVESFRRAIEQQIEEETDCSSNSLHYQVGSREMDMSGLGNIMFGFFFNQFPDTIPDSIANMTQAANPNSLGQFSDNSDDRAQVRLGRALADQVGYFSSIDPQTVERLSVEENLS